jgi:hypothetical protein
MHMRRSLLPLALLLAALAPGGAQAARWSAPQTVSAPHTFAGPLSLATAADGSLIAAWPWQDNVGDDARGGAATAARRPGTSAFTTERPAPDGLLSIAPYATRQTVAVALQGLPGRSGPTGATLQRLKVAFGSSSGGFATARTLVTAPILGRPQLAAAGARALITWIEATRTSTGAVRRVVRAIERADGRFGAPFTLSGRGRADVLTAAIGPRGDEVVALVRGEDLLARVRRAGHGWGALHRVARADGATRWQLTSGVDPRGQVRVAWRRHQLTRDGVPGRTALEATALLVGRSAFTAAQTLVADGASAPVLTQISGGWAVADVETTPDGPRPALHRTHGGDAFGPVQYAAPAQSGARGAALAFSPAGGITVAWVQPVDGQDGDGVARAATLDPAVAAPAFGPVEAISPVEAVHEVALGTDERGGRTVAVWTARPGGTGPAVPIAQIHTVVRSAVHIP